jgi:hypothetical protein
VLASAISPEVQAWQQRFQQQALKTANARPAGICEPVAVADVSTGQPPATPAASAAQGPLPPAGTAQMLRRACRENVAGFESAYQVTFYAAFVALFLGLMLPGWPARWVGRQAAGPVPTAH